MTPERRRQIDGLYHSALERDPSQRTAFLNHACAGDSALRQEVESLLAHEGTAHGFPAAPALEDTPTVLGDDAASSLIGRQLGSCKIQSLLGAGGMGEVYRAKDLKLGRDVAIKILPPSFAIDPERVRRFEREARLLAALNHPHIAAIYGFEEVEDVRGLVLELVEGPTLAERIKRGPLPVSQALDLALQIADALEAAHEKGIIHRDLKPANIKITADGAVKVLDFGLAKAWAGDTAALDPSQSPTVTATGVLAGALLGTPAYMSPEQASGEGVDKRTDIWAFGCVLYEMLTGKRTFSADDQSGTLARVLTKEPDWDALPSITPPGIRKLLQRCLEKDCKHRLRDIGDASLEIEEASAAVTSSHARAHQRDPRRLSRHDAVGQNAVTTQRKRLWKRTIAVVFAVLVASVLTTAVLRREIPSDAVRVRRFSMQLDYVRPVISPDGRHLAYRSGGSLWVRDLDSETPREIPGGKASGGYYTDIGYYLTWSPDSQYLIFPAENELRRVSVLQGGSATIICTFPAGQTSGRKIGGLAWSSDGETILFSRYGSGIYEVSAHGGAPKLLWEEDHADDIALIDTPRGRAIVYAVLYFPGHRLIVRTPDGERRTIAPLETGWPELVYAPTGHILFRKSVGSENASIWALPFSPTALEAQGEPFLVERSGQGMSLAQDGTFVYLDIGRIRRQFLAWRDRSGNMLNKASEGHEIIDAARLSPDGNQAVVTATDNGRSALWLYDVQRFVRTQFALGDDAKRKTVLFAFWPKRGDEIYYSLINSQLAEETELFAKPADGFGQPRQLPFPKGLAVAQDRTADGRYVIVGYRSKPGTIGIWFWRNGTGKPEAVNFSQNSENEQGMTLSPNERYLAYTSTISGRVEVYVRPFPDGSGRWQVSSGGGVAPKWGPDGTELFFYEGNQLMRIGVSTGSKFSTSPPPMPLFEHPSLRGVPAPFARYDISPDGQKFLTVESEREFAQPVVRVVENWLSEFRRAAHGGVSN
jgi:eukaryotic-like serine/threonine-protein kinase